MAETYETIIDEMIQWYVDDPVYIIQADSAEGESRYLQNKRHNYNLTVKDTLELANKLGAKDNAEIKILEIGPFLGVVSLALAKLGFTVSVIDIPEYMQAEKLLARYDAYNIRHEGVNLCRYNIPFEDSEFDIILCCEVLEHLNFNPVPVVAEINRILKKDGFFYLAVPNLTRYKNRRNMLLGGSIYDPISTLFAQLGPNLGSTVGIHWREYNIAETRDLLQRLGFAIERQYLFDNIDFRDNSTLKWSERLRKAFLQWKPSWKQHQTTIGRKIRDNDIKFHFTDATRPCR